MRFPEKGVWLAATLIALVYAGIIGSFASGYAGGADSSGYFGSARLLAAGRTSLPFRQLPELDPGSYSVALVTPLGFRPGPDPGTMVPIYPPGLPLHMAAMAPLTGWDRAGAAVNTVAAAAALLLLVAVAGGLGIPRWWGLAGSVVFAVNPLTLHFYGWLMSDGLTTTWSLAAVAGALAARRRTGWACVAGAAYGMAGLVRLSGLLLLPAILVILPRRASVWLIFLAGGLPAAVFLAGYNTLTYGEAFTSGYAGHAALFAWSNIPLALAHYLHWLSTFLSPLLLVFAASLLIPAVRSNRAALVLLAWVLPVLIFYSAYWHTREHWWYLRFILPVLPAIVLSGFATAGMLIQCLRRRIRQPWLHSTIAALLAAALIVWPAVSSLRFAIDRNVIAIVKGDREYPRAIAWMEGLAPTGAPIACMQVSGAMFAYSKRPILRYDTTKTHELTRVVDAMKDQGVETHALLFEFEIEPFLSRFPGMWERVAESGRASLWRRSEVSAGKASQPGP